MNICITGSAGLIGSAAAERFLKNNHRVVGIDNNMRRALFGPDGDTSGQIKSLSRLPNYTHKHVDIRDKKFITKIFKSTRFDAVIHAAGQPSHDKAGEIPILDFEINALGTLNMLEATRSFCPKAIFIYTSTNKVYGDNPNKISLKENKTRYIPSDRYFSGFDESTQIDKTIHSFMGASKLTADIYTQEYGKNLGLKTTSLRLGCVTGGAHAGVKNHGFLSYLIKSLIHKGSYEIIGYKGKQIRDQIHADDVCLAFEQIIKNPLKGEVFNLGGGKKNSASILELINSVSLKLNMVPKITINKKPRTGDHVYYVTDCGKFNKFYPKWHITKNINQIIDEIISHEKKAGF